MPYIQSNPWQEAVNGLLGGAQVGMQLAGKRREMQHLQHIEDLQAQAALRESEMHALQMDAKRQEMSLRGSLAPYQVRSAAAGAALDEQRVETDAKLAPLDVKRAELDVRRGEQQVAAGDVAAQEHATAMQERQTARQTADDLALNDIDSFSEWMFAKAGSDPDLQDAAAEIWGDIAKLTQRNPAGVAEIAKTLPRLGQMFERRIWDRTRERHTADAQKWLTLAGQEEGGLGSQARAADIAGSSERIVAMLNDPDPKVQLEGEKNYQQYQSALVEAQAMEHLEQSVLMDIMSKRDSLAARISPDPMAQPPGMQPPKPNRADIERQYEMSLLLNHVQTRNLTKKELQDALEKAWQIMNAPDPEPEAARAVPGQSDVFREMSKRNPKADPAALWQQAGSAVAPGRPTQADAEAFSREWRAINPKGTADEFKRAWTERMRMRGGG